MHKILSVFYVRVSFVQAKCNESYKAILTFQYYDKAIIMVLKSIHTVMLCFVTFVLTVSDELSKCLTHIRNTNCMHRIAWHRIAYQQIPFIV